MELSEAVRRRHMVRSFSDVPVDRQVLAGVLELARHAPSAGNSQGWDAVVLEGPSQTALFWKATTTAQWRRRSPRWPGLSRAPVVVTVFSHPGAYLARYGEADKKGSGLDAGTEAWPVPYWDVDAGMAVLLVLLGASEAGLGACFLGNFRGDRQLRRELGVPEDRRYVGAVLLGHPGGVDKSTASARRRRRPFEEVFHQGRW
jgi:nitroreductase